MADLIMTGQFIFTFVQSVTVSCLARPTPICPFTGKHLTLNYYSILCQILTHWSSIYHAKCTCMLYDIWFTLREDGYLVFCGTHTQTGKREKKVK